MFEMRKSHVPLNVKHYVSFKRSLFTLPRHVKVSQYYTELMHYESKKVGQSHSVSSSSREIKNQATILLLCVMTSNYIPVESPSHEEYFNLYLKGV